MGWTSERQLNTECDTLHFATLASVTVLHRLQNGGQALFLLVTFNVVTIVHNMVTNPVFHRHQRILEEGSILEERPELAPRHHSVPDGF